MRCSSSFDHPLWVLFSSGTTGKPKGIVHGHGGVLLNHLVLVGLHLDVGKGDRFTWYSSTNWMMWKIVVSGLATGATIVVYDGSPRYPHMDSFWELCADAAITVTGTSPAYLRACEDAEKVPGFKHDLSTLKTVGVTGSPVPRSSFDWTRDAIGADVQLASSSGGTDVVSAFAAANPLTPVWGVELSAPCLGVSLEARNEEGHPVHGQVVELVITQPIPSMPVGLWGDHDRSRLHDTYFANYPGVWRHGDWITMTDRGSIVIHGRSAATLNRKGVRLGSAWSRYRPAHFLWATVSPRGIQEMARPRYTRSHSNDSGWAQPLLPTGNSQLLSRTPTTALLPKLVECLPSSILPFREPTALYFTK